MKYVPSELQTKATAKLEASIEEELKKEDPDPESAQAKEIFKEKEDEAS